MTFEINEIKYAVGYKGRIKYLIPEDNEKYFKMIPIVCLGNLSYLNRSSEVSEAIREWEITHNIKLSPRSF